MLVSVLFRIPCAVADSVCGTFIGSLPIVVLCLCAFIVAAMVLCPESFLFLRLKHVTVAVAFSCSQSFCFLCLNQVIMTRSVKVGLYGCGEESDGCDAYY